MTSFTFTDAVMIYFIGVCLSTATSIFKNRLVTKYNSYSFYITDLSDTVYIALFSWAGLIVEMCILLSVIADNSDFYKKLDDYVKYGNGNGNGNGKWTDEHEQE